MPLLVAPSTYLSESVVFACLFRRQAYLDCSTGCKSNPSNQSDELVLKIFSSLSVLSNYRSQSEPGGRPMPM